MRLVQGFCQSVWLRCRRELQYSGMGPASVQTIRDAAVLSQRTVDRWPLTGGRQREGKIAGFYRATEDGISGQPYFPIKGMNWQGPNVCVANPSPCLKINCSS